MTPKKGKGRFTLMAQFNKKRTKLTLGMIDRPEAKAFAGNCELLRDCRKRGARIPATLATWIDSLSEKHFDQLASIGLLTPFDRKLTVQGLIRAFLNDYKSKIGHGIQKATYESAARKLDQLPRFLRRSKVAELEPTTNPETPNAKPKFSKDAQSLLKKTESYMREHYTKPTWSRTHKMIRQVGKWGVDSGLIRANPFTLLPCPGEANQARNVEVPRQVVIDAAYQSSCADTALALILGRFAGFRLSSEARKLKWEHIDFEIPAITIHGKGGKVRRAPLFEEVRNALEDQRKLTGTKTFVLSQTYLQQSDATHYKKALQAIEKVTDRYTRLRQNLRTSCENDWYEIHPQKDVERWIGHSRKIARDHYDQDRNSRIKQAVERTR